jgi:hypothetical protein
MKGGGGEGGLVGNKVEGMFRGFAVTVGQTAGVLKA